MKRQIGWIEQKAELKTGASNWADTCPNWKRFRHCWGWGVHLETNPDEGEEQAEGSEDEAVELEAPSEGGDPGTAELDLETLLLTLPTSWGCLVGVGVLHPRTAHPLLSVHPHFTRLTLFSFRFQCSIRWASLGGNISWFIFCCNSFAVPQAS